MKLASAIRWGLLLPSFFIISGCINSTAAIKLIDTDLTKKKSAYLVQLPEDKENYKIIKAHLIKRGYSVTSGVTDKVTNTADLVITYIDKWYWDITPYMLDLTIVFRDPMDNFPLAAGSSFHTSASRLLPEDMVDEVLTNIFNEKYYNRGSK